MENNQLQDSIFEKIMPVLDAYVLCKLKLQQFKKSSERFPAIEQEIRYNIKFLAESIKAIVSADADNQ